MFLRSAMPEITASRCVLTVVSASAVCSSAGVKVAAAWISRILLLLTDDMFCGSCPSKDLFCWIMSVWWRVLLDHAPLMVCSAGSCPSDDMFCWIMPLWRHVLLDHAPLMTCSAGSCPSDDMFCWIMSLWRHILLDHVPLNWSISMACSLKKGCEIAVKCLLKTFQTSWGFQGALLLGPTPSSLGP